MLISDITQTDFRLYRKCFHYVIAVTPAPHGVGLGGESDAALPVAETASRFQGGAPFRGHECGHERLAQRGKYAPPRNLSEAELHIKRNSIRTMLYKKQNPHDNRHRGFVLALPIFPGRLQPSIVGRSELN